MRRLWNYKSRSIETKKCWTRNCDKELEFILNLMYFSEQFYLNLIKCSEYNIESF